MNQNPTTFLLLVLLLRLSTSTSTSQIPPPPPPPPSDAVSLLSFKSKSDLNNKLLYTLNEPFDYCQWQGVKCLQGYVIHLLLPSFNLRGILAPDTLSHLYQLRVLSLHNNSLYGPIPDFSSLSNLKSLSLSHNSFSGSLPPSLLSLHRLQTLDFSFNNFSGPIPVRILSLDRLLILKLEFNRFNGTVPPLNQPFLFVLNLTGNNLTGKIPVTPTLSRFNSSSFFSNFDLCGEIVNKECKSRDSFFGRDFNQSAPSVQNTESTDVILSPVTHSKRDGNRLVLGFSIAAMVLVAGIVCFYASTRKGTRKSMARDSGIEEKIEFETKVKGIEKNQKSGDNVVFNEEGEGLFSIEELMRASAELLGRGTIGITYKAVLCNRLMVTVKRMDGCKSAATSDQEFERHMEVVCGLRHPNLVPIRAYFQARGERLVVYDYQPNGSLFNLIHGSRSARAKPLHWTSCLKIAEDLAQGIAYIHQASKLIHGNLKSTNVLLGADFEACLTDYCLSVLVDCSEDADSSHYRAPETRKSGHRATHKSDVYAFGVLLLELLTGRHPSQHPFLEPTDVADWVRAVREDDGGESHQLGMLTEVASICSTTSPEQRPTMWQVLKMIHEIKESVMTEDSESSGV